jgi:hypothetical protein
MGAGPHFSATREWGAWAEERVSASSSGRLRAGLRAAPARRPTDARAGLRTPARRSADARAPILELWCLKWGGARLMPPAQDHHNSKIDGIGRNKDGLRRPESRAPRSGPPRCRAARVAPAAAGRAASQGQAAPRQSWSCGARSGAVRGLCHPPRTTTTPRSTGQAEAKAGEAVDGPAPRTRRGPRACRHRPGTPARRTGHRPGDPHTLRGPRHREIRGAGFADRGGIRREARRHPAGDTAASGKRHR